MADQRVTIPTRVCDFTTLTQGLAVDSAGNASIGINKVNSNTILTGNGVTGTGSLRVTIASDNTVFGVNATLLAGSAVIGSLVANQSVNVSQIAGVASNLGNGTTASGTLRVTISSDSTGQVTLAAGSQTIGALTANQSVNLSQIAGTTTSVGNGVTNAGCQRVTIASDNSPISVTDNFTPTNPVYDITNITTPLTIAANASSNGDSANIKSKYLRQVVITGSLPFKAILSALVNSVAVVKVALFGGPLDPIIYTPPAPNFFQSGNTAGNDGFRAAITNLDPSLSGDFYVSYAYADN